MRQLAVAMAPAFFFWTLPLAPAAYALVMGAIEMVTKPVQGRPGRSSSRAAGTVHVSGFGNQRETAATTEVSG